MTIKDIKDNGLLLFECISGSKAYGLATEKSDTDIKGVFYLSKEQFYGLEHIEQVSNESNDEVYYELGRFVELLMKNNPNILEMLATPEDCVLYKHPVFERLQISMFLSKLCKETFGGYAMTQIKKARGYNKKIVNPVELLRKRVLDFCFIINGHSSMPAGEWLQLKGYLQQHCGLVNIPHAKGMYALFYDQTGNKHYRGIVSGDNADDVCVSAIAKSEQQVEYLFFNKDGYSVYCKEYAEYWNWVAKRNEERYAGNMQHGKNYDAKNMMHTIRLLQVAKEISEENKLTIKRDNREELLSIKAGTYDYDDLIVVAENLMKQIEGAYDESTLPETPDNIMIEKVLIEMRTELYR